MEALHADVEHAEGLPDLRDDRLLALHVQMDRTAAILDARCQSYDFIIYNYNAGVVLG
jgi:hypothetical protein